ncbi:hypothetical protein A9Q84_13465 [Halobacteriovorax marinus]|uniref:Serine aminopeptidase S33 domain-containing protein n=1 Tax=Halobacteriovorax marinus TaxID=97084 RepID=A0A1Y5F8Q6_9BACT|nr:hypothetical protein A9Q84_13465 [Halobacteriovorax marinus]
MTKRLCLIILLTIQNIYALNCSNIKQELVVPEDSKGIVLLVHGLNLAPKKMQELGEVFKKNQVAPIYISLTGHNENTNWSQVTKKRWRVDFYKPLCQAQVNALQKNIPLYAVGHSLGAVIIQDALEKYKVPFKEVFYLSPAFKTRWYTGFITLLFKMGLTTSIPSSNFVEYRAKSDTSLLAYKAMWEINESLKFEDTIKKNFFIDLRDEMVDFTTTKSLCNIITNCHFHRLIIKPKERQKTIYHLNVDRDSNGVKSWQYLTKTLEKALK